MIAYATVGPRHCEPFTCTTAHQAAVAFYEQALGMKQLQGGKQLGVIDRLAEDPEPPKRALLAFGSKPSAALELRRASLAAKPTLLVRCQLFWSPLTGRV